MRVYGVSFFRCWLLRGLAAIWSVFPVGLCGEPPELKPVQTVPRIEVEDSQTRVFIAKVYLAVGDLVLEDGALVGNYALRVPLRPDKSEGGTFHLPVESALADIAREGGELDGRGFNFKKARKERTIVATIYPAEPGTTAGRLDLWIDVGDRELAFTTRYRLVTEEE